MKYINLVLIFSIVTTLLLNSCTQSTKNRLLPGVSGAAGEVLLVIEKTKWNARVGDSIRNVLLLEHLALPQREPVFDIINIPSKAFNRMFKAHRNILNTRISSDIKKAKMTVQKNPWSKPQTYIKLEAPNDAEFVKLLYKNRKNITELFVTAERERIVSNYKRYEIKKTREYFEKNHNISLNVPGGYKFFTKNKDFVWMAYHRDAENLLLGFFVYYYNYTDTSQFSLENLVNMRDSVLKTNVPSTAEGSYMTTEHIYTPDYKRFSVKDRFTVELRGLWEVKGGFMGGPFISHSTVDKKRNRIVTVEGYVFAPKKDKRNYLRQVEGILYTTDFFDEPEVSEELKVKN